MRRLILAASALALTACTAPDAGAPAGSAAPGAPAVAQPVDYGQANVPDFRPAFAGQTRAPAVQRTHAFVVQPIASDLDKSWALEPLGDGSWLVTEKQGRFRLVTAGGRVLPVGGTIPAVDARGQGGLLDVALAPDFARSRRIFWSYAEPREGGNGTAVASGVISAGLEPVISDVRVIWRMQPTLASTLHFGSRLVFARDGTLFVALGERSILPGRAQAQDPNSHFGKVVRINADGSVPRDNPFVNRAGTRPDIYAIGIRNIQSAALHPQTGELWEVEHGPRGGDELNRIQAGRDYGWPTITYGEEYSGQAIGGSQTARAGMEQPVYYWDPVIAPSGMEFYTGQLFPAWRGSVFIGGLRSQGLVRLTLNGERVTGEERIPLGARIRDVKQGSDGALYALTDEDNGRILRITPK
jgi:glucose/arabinose dehydrogenase